MLNRLSMPTQQSIATLHRSGPSNREIVCLLSIDRGAMNNQVRLIRAESQALKETDSGSDEIQNRPNPRTGRPNARRIGSKPAKRAHRV